MSVGHFSLSCYPTARLQHAEELSYWLGLLDTLYCTGISFGLLEN